jgi:hypothetical protein
VETDADGDPIVFVIGLDGQVYFAQLNAAGT